MKGIRNQKIKQRTFAILKLTEKYLTEAGYSPLQFISPQIFSAHQNDATVQIDEWLTENNPALKEFNLFDEKKYHTVLKKANEFLVIATDNANKAFEMASVSPNKYKLINSFIKKSKTQLNKISKIQFLPEKIIKDVENINDILVDSESLVKDYQDQEKNTTKTSKTEEKIVTPDWKTYQHNINKDKLSIKNTISTTSTTLKRDLNKTFRSLSTKNVFGYKSSSNVINKLFGVSSSLVGGTVSLFGHGMEGGFKLTGDTLKFSTDVLSMKAAFIPKYGNVLSTGISMIGDIMSGFFSFFGKVGGKLLSTIGGLLGGLISTIGSLANAPGNFLSSHSTLSLLSSLGGLLWMFGGMSKGSFASGLGDTFKGGFSFEKLVNLPTNSLLDTTSLMGGALSLVPGMEGTGISMMIIPQLIKLIKRYWEDIKKYFDDSIKNLFGYTDREWDEKKKIWTEKISGFFDEATTIFKYLKDIFDGVYNLIAPDVNASTMPTYNVAAKKDLYDFYKKNNLKAEKDFPIEDFIEVAKNKDARQQFIKTTVEEYKKQNKDVTNEQINSFVNDLDKKLDSFLPRKTTNNHNFTNETDKKYGLNITKNTSTETYKVKKDENILSNSKIVKNDRDATSVKNGINAKLKDGELPFTTLGAGVHINNINSDFYERFLSAAREYYQKTGKKVLVTDGYRTYDEQIDLKRRKPGLAALPGNSMHGYGMAMDIDSNAANKMDEMGLFKKYGIERPMLGRRQGEKNEPWHIQPTGLDVNGLKSTGKSGLKVGNEYSQFLGKNVTQTTNNNSNNPSMFEDIFTTFQKIGENVSSQDFVDDILKEAKKNVTPSRQQIEDYEKIINLPRRENIGTKLMDKIAKPLLDGITGNLKGIQEKLVNINTGIVKQNSSTRDNKIIFDSQESWLMVQTNILCI